MSFVSSRSAARRGLARTALTAAAAVGLAIAGAAGAGAAGAAPGAAAPAPSGPPAAAPAKPNCVLHLSRGGAQDCYATAAEAVADATNGRVTGAPPATGRTAGPDSAAAERAFTERVDRAAGKRGAVRAGAGGTLIGIEYQHDFWYAEQGRKWFVEVDYGCDGNESTTEWEVRNLGGNWWNDEISSAKVYANCKVWHFEHSDYNGRSSFTGFISNLELVGMNDLTSSLKWN